MRCSLLRGYWPHPSLTTNQAIRGSLTQSSFQTRHTVAIRSYLILLFVMWLVVLACSSQESMTPDQPLTTGTWANGCVQLSPDSSGFRLTGICCAYLIMPPVKLNRNKQFTTKADYYAYTGAGNSRVAAMVTGELSTDGTMLALTYSAGSTTRTLQLTPGTATLHCLCNCN